MTIQLTIPDRALRLVEVPAFSALTITIRATLSTLAETAMPADLRLRHEAARLGLDEQQPTQWIYTGVNGDETNEFQVEVALPVTHVKAVLPVGVEFKTFMPFHCMSYTYTGSWADFGKLYDLLFTQLYRDGHKNDGRIREVYLVADAESPDNCGTEIQIAVA